MTKVGKVFGYRSGSPFNTGAVVSAPKMASIETVRHFKTSHEGNQTAFSLDMADADRIYGLGESMGRLDKRGKLYRLYAKDETLHTPEKKSLYGAHPFFIVSGRQNFGVFVDYPSEVVVDAGFTERTLLEIRIADNNFDLYIIEGETPSEVMAGFLALVGQPVIPPRWAFGYQQCRYSYMNESEVRGIAENMKRHDIPCDAIYLDIDYMDGYKCFTVDKKNFPDLPKLTADLGEEGIHVVTILDPGIKVEQGYDVYESGLSGDHFCVDESGKYFTGAVWPGLCHFPDFLNSACRSWWGELYRGLVDAGISGFWNDMNEPVVFYTGDGIRSLQRKLEAIKDSEDLGNEAVPFISELGSFWGDERYYERFFHRLDDGARVPHAKVHNLYGTLMAKATYDGLVRLDSERRQFVLSRSSYIGMHRYAVVWTGDNHSWWEHILTHIQMMLSLGLTGFFYVGADIGGFSADASPDLMIRWTQLGAFSPLFRNHSVKGSRDQEPWRFDERSLENMRQAIRLRYALLAYTYSEYIRSVEDARPFIAPLFLSFDDEVSRDVDDQFFYGEALMVAPIHRANASGRFVHLPQGKWLLWLAKNPETRDLSMVNGGQSYFHAALNEIPVFVRENKLFFLNEVVNATDNLVPETLTVIGLVTGEAETTFIWDDGSANYSAERTARLQISVRSANGAFDFAVNRLTSFQGEMPVKQVQFEIYDSEGTRHLQTVMIDTVAID